MTTITSMSRRDFMKLTGLSAGGLVLAATLPERAIGFGPSPLDPSTLSPWVFLQITPEGEAVVWVSRSEMGQGVRTGLPMIAAEELGIDWKEVRIRQADAAADDRYGSQLTGGSLSVRTLYDPLRRCGAAAREMLKAAAARRWNVEPAACEVRSGEVVHAPGNRRLPFGDLAEAARDVPVPAVDETKLTEPSAFRLMGTRVERMDHPDIVTGRAVFGMDQRAPGMLFAAVARSPVYGGTVESVDSSGTMKVDGVRKIVEVEGRDGSFYLAPGVAVIAENTWAALEGVRALRVTWNEGSNREAGTGDLRERFRALAAEPGEVARNDGDAGRALERAAKTIEATYELPFLSHAPMEPMNCTIHVRKRSCEIWSPTQNPQTAQRVVAEYLGLPREAVTVHVTLLGGGFGRRLYPDTELEAAMIARQVDAPVKVVWTREDDIRHDRYRPASMHLLRGGLDSRGLPVAWTWHILNTHTDRFLPEDFPAYAVPSYRVEYTHVPWILPRGAWRATTLSQNPFVVQCFLDELAEAGGRDPVELRLEMLRGARGPDPGESRYDRDRMIRVLETAAEASGWKRRLPAGRGRGIAFQYCYGSYVALVAEAESIDHRERVRRIVCAVDCGEVVSPDLVEAQVEGAVAFALSAALKQQITVEGGRVREGNFHDYPMIRMDEMPQIETRIVTSHEAPGGMGETPLPPTAPAVANAIFAASGRRIRRLPIEAAGG
jgi:isoquinoline 1-oxidoreductase beta subunit